MRKTRKQELPRARYARARFYGALEIALVGLLLILGSLKASGAETLGVADLRSKSSSVRYRAAVALGEAKDPASGPALKAAIAAETVPAARQAMIEALGALGDRSAVGFLSSLAVGDTEEGARVAAMVALHRLNAPPSAWDSIEALALDPKQPEGVRRSSLVLVGANKGRKALGTIRGAARDRDPKLRREALNVLVRIDDDEARPELERAKDDADAGVRAEAARLLKRRVPGSGKGKR